MLFKLNLVYKAGIAYMEHNPASIMIFGDLVHDPKFAVVSGALTACGTV
jgi:hypothetical protein